MAPVTLKIRVKKDDDFELEIDDEETIEALAVVIFSVRPELGEDFKLLRNGRMLKPEMVLSTIGMKNGDLLFIAKTAAKSESSNVASASELSVPESAPVSSPTSAPELPSTSADISSSPPSKCPRLDESMDVDAPSSENIGSSSLEVVESEQVPMNSEEALPELPTQPSTSALQPDTMPPNEDPESSAIPKSPIDAFTSDEHPCMQGEKDESDEPLKPEPAAVEVDASSAAGLMAFAALLENGGPSPPPAKLAEIIKESASRMLILEGAVKDFSQALQMVNVISATGLRGAMNELGMDTSPKPQAEEGRSFLIKKGDADLHELHQKASTPMARTTSGTTGGGALSSTPLTKEEMDKARQARLAKLEAMQSEKQKEKDEADEKSRARDAMFSRRADLPSKPLGKH